MRALKASVAGTTCFRECLFSRLREYNVCRCEKKSSKIFRRTASDPCQVRATRDKLATTHKLRRNSELPCFAGSRSQKFTGRLRRIVHDLPRTIGAPRVASSDFGWTYTGIQNIPDRFGGCEMVLHSKCYRGLN